MGPLSKSSTPSRPNFDWDIRTSPWTDGRGIQDGNVRSVILWEQLLDGKLPSENFKMFCAYLRGVCLKSHLFGRALDLCFGIPDYFISSEGGVAGIVSSVHKLDGLLVFPKVK